MFEFPDNHLISNKGLLSLKMLGNNTYCLTDTGAEVQERRIQNSQPRVAQTIAPVGKMLDLFGALMYTELSYQIS